MGSIELLSCTNKNCEAFGHRILPYDAKFCPKCGLRINRADSSESANACFHPRENDVFTVGNSMFCKIYAACPTCMLEYGRAVKTHWIHADNNCGGYIYMGTEGSFICGKCGLERLPSFWKPLCRIHDNSDFNSMVITKTPDKRSVMSFVFQMMPYLGCMNTFHMIDVLKLKDLSI